MAVIVTIPRQGLSIESCLFVEWHKTGDDPVKKGDVLCEFETDKAVFEIEAPADGFLLKTLYEPGDIVPVLAPIAVIGNKDEDISKILDDIKDNKKQGIGTEPREKEDSKDEKITKKELIHELPPAHDNKIRISPRARKRARQYGVYYQHIKGTGPGNRIIEKDILAQKAKYESLTPRARDGVHQGYFPPSKGTGIGGRILFKDLIQGEPKVQVQEDDETIIIPVSGMRKTIADKMFLSLTTTAQLTMDTSFDAAQLLDFRKKLKAMKNDNIQSQISLTDLIHFAVEYASHAYQCFNIFRKTRTTITGSRINKRKPNTRIRTNT